MSGVVARLEEYARAAGGANPYGRDLSNLIGEAKLELMRVMDGARKLFARSRNWQVGQRLRFDKYVNCLSIDGFQAINGYKRAYAYGLAEEAMESVERFRRVLRNVSSLAEASQCDSPTYATRIPAKIEYSGVDEVTVAVSEETAKLLRTKHWYRFGDSSDTSTCFKGQFIKRYSNDHESEFNSFANAQRSFRGHLKFVCWVPGALKNVASILVWFPNEV